MESSKCPHCSGTSTDFRDVIRRFSKDRGSLIPILHALQDSMGYLTAEAMEETACWLGIPASEVYGTATFYTLFATEPRGKYIVRLCDSAPCHIEGSKGIKRAIQQSLGIKPGETTEDGLFSFELVSCMGLCGVAPAIMVNKDVYGNLTPEAIPGILNKYNEEGA